MAAVTDHRPYRADRPAPEQLRPQVADPDDQRAHQHDQYPGLRPRQPDPRHRRQQGDHAVGRPRTAPDRHVPPRTQRPGVLPRLQPRWRTLATGGDDQVVRLWDVTGRREIGASLTGHAAPVVSMTFAPDTTSLTTGDGEATVRRWNIAVPTDPAATACSIAARTLTRAEWTQSGPGRPAAMARPDHRRPRASACMPRPSRWSVPTRVSVSSRARAALDCSTVCTLDVTTHAPTGSHGIGRAGERSDRSGGLSRTPQRHQRAVGEPAQDDKQESDRCGCPERGRSITSPVLTLCTDSAREG
ncbi:hypothetical protein ABZ801_40995 [Actinomadura sp. NPDC047616]|uniref:WD40 repeat domain-containing protein n=1 Tax=Actinomadura sp. NPDC047616 TaxID=3155914 RepID=UPI0033C59A42